MYKSLAILAIATVANAVYVPMQGRARLMNDMAVSSIAVSEIRAKNGMRPLQYHDWRQEQAKKRLEAANPHMVQACSWKDINFIEQSFECAKGFAFGLQFSPQKEGACYVAVSQAIEAAETMQDLLARFYIPSTWGDIVRIWNSYVSFGSAIAAECNLSKLIKTVTTDASTFFPAAISRVGGGFIMEIPNTYLKMKKSCECYDAAKYAGNLFALFFDYYI